MFELMIMRHAKSDWSSHTADFDRPLNNRGCRDAGRMAKHLNKLKLTPDIILISSAKRTRQTAELLLDDLDVPVDQTIISDSLYLASMNTLCDVIKKYAEDDQRLMLLAHNPGVDELVSYLSSAPPPLADNGNLMATCAVAVFEVDSLDDINRAGSVRLTELLRPKEIT